MKRFMGMIIAMMCVSGMAGISRANPVPWELYPEIIFESESNRVIFSFLGMASAEEYSTMWTPEDEWDPQTLTADILKDGEWQRIDVEWTALDEVRFENEMSLTYHVYTRYALVWPCPGAGEYQIRMTQYSEDDGELIDSTFFESTVTCEAAGNPDNTALADVPFTEYDQSDSDVAGDTEDGEPTGTSDTSRETSSDETDDDADGNDGAVVLNDDSSNGCAIDNINAAGSRAVSLWQLLTLMIY